MNIDKRQLPQRSELLQVANHFFFATALLFVAHQNMLHGDTGRTQPLFVAQASSLQPQTPPPGFDPDEMSVEEVDLPGSPDGLFARKQ
ncbi:MAG: hypothetical protein CVU28_02440 [Betaproteobacteria bacterium HGW-Betaproteobacteria-21]|nr:MAG: hypothetical protein CVU28_02440 [Betaproteobacteria bacterium HGW-Betaproteobacteria-21]